jgi:protocatechuate 3,4-dioxygenase beta subunit
VQQEDLMTDNQVLSRRRMLGTVGAAGAGLLVAGRTPVSSLFGGDEALAASSCASLTPAKEIGPYFVEEKLNRSNITTDPDTGVAVAGVPLALKLTLMNENNGCEPLAGAQVDIWHAAPSGLYSDESGEGTSGKRYLRGYQLSDSSGLVQFTTVYPGWYSGRAVHVHARIRTFDSSGNATYDFLAQLFFDDSLTDTVYTQSPYSARATRDTRNADDRVYGSDGASVLLNLASDGSGGYVGTFTFGLGDASDSSGSTTTTTTTTPTTTTTTASGTTDTSVAASLAAASCTRGALGTRTLHARVRTKEAVSLDVRLLRGSKLVARKQVTSLASGTHTVSVPIARRVSAGRVTLSVTATDASSNRKVLTRILRIPARMA